MRMTSNPLDVNKMADVEEPILGFFWLLHLNNEVWKNGTAQVTFSYLNMISADFQPIPYCYFAGYPTRIHV